MKNSTRHALIAASAVACSALTFTSAFAADPMTSATGGKVADNDRTFVTKAAIGGMTEIQASKVAQDKGTSPAVKDYSAKMIADHTKVADELMSISGTKSVTPPATLDKPHQASVDKLSKMAGADFDKAYMKQMVSDHKATIAVFEKEAKDGKDGDLKAFAGKTLPSLQDHLKMAQAAQDGMK